MIRAFIPAFLFGVCVSSYAHAATKVDSQIIMQYIHEDNRDLGTGNASVSDSLSEQFYLGVRGHIDRYRSWRVAGRVFNINSRNAANTIDDGEPSKPITSADDRFLELREAYYRHRNIASGLDLQIGRQRLREPRGLWWGSDNDLLKLSYKTKQGDGFIALGEDLGSYRTGQAEIARDDGRFRVLGEHRYEYRQDHWIEPRFVFEHDHSGERSVGAALSREDIDREDLTGLYAGLRAKGAATDRYGLHKFFYRADVIGLGGKQSVETLRGNNGAYIVDAVKDEGIGAWAFDGGVSAQPWESGVVFKAGYAMGSKDFRQTGLEGGSSRTDLERHANRNYGEAFRPELANMHIVTMGVTYPVNAVWTVGGDYFRYRQVDTDNDVRRSGLRAAPNGQDSDLGQEVDVRITADLENIIPVKALRGVQWRTVGGAFDPGDAYAHGNDDMALRVFSELRVRF